MSSESKHESHDYRIKDGGPWANAWKIAAALGVLGLLGAGAGFAQDHKRFAFSYLFAYAVFLTVSLGSLFFVFVQHLTSAGWSVTVRRTAEFFMSALPVFALLFLPIAAGIDELYPWTQDHSAGHAIHASAHTAGEGSHGEAGHGEAGHGEAGHGAAQAEHGHAAGPGGHVASVEEIEHALHGEVMHKKSAYLNKTFFFIRAVGYFLIWFFLSQKFFKNSVDQDGTKDLEFTRKNQRLAPGAAGLFALSLTFAVFDWYMALLPQWYSTIFGVQMFSASVVAALSMLTLVTLSLRNTGLTGKAINTEHFHDLGKLLFGFTCFWAYISFSQFFLIWYASIPEETLFFHMRWSDGPWKGVSLAIVALHFVVPFFMLISRNVKRFFDQKILQLGAVLLFCIHIVEMYWLVMPNYAVATHPGLAVEEVARMPEALSFHWLDVACLLGVGGVYLAVVFHRMAKHNLIPVGDPRLDRALHLNNG